MYPLLNSATLRRTRHPPLQPCKRLERGSDQNIDSRLGKHLGETDSSHDWILFRPLLFRPEDSNVKLYHSRYHVANGGCAQTIIL